MQAADRIDKNIHGANSIPSFFSKTANNMRCVCCQIRGGPLRQSIIRRGHQSLDLEKNGARSSIQQITVERSIPLSSPQERQQRIGTSCNPLSFISKTPFRAWSQIDFSLPANAVKMVSITFKEQQRIDHMLQNLGTCKIAFFGDVSYQKHRHIVVFRQADQLQGALAHLADAAGALTNSAEYRLYRIHHQQLRMNASTPSIIDSSSVSANINK